MSQNKPVLNGSASAIIPTLTFEVDRGDRASTGDLMKHPEAVEQIKKVLGWLGLSSAIWVGKGWHGSPHTAVTSMQAVFEENRFKIRVGRYRGFLAKPKEANGMEVTQQGLWARWNTHLKESSAKALATEPAPEPEPESAANTRDTKWRPRLTKESTMEFLAAIFARRDPASDFVMRSRVKSAIATQLGWDEANMENGQVLSIARVILSLTRQKLLVELDESTFGFDDVALKELKQRVPAVKPAKAAVVQPPSPPPVRVQAPAPQPPLPSVPAPKPPPVEALAPGLGLIQQLKLMKEKQPALDRLRQEKEEIAGKLLRGKTEIEAFQKKVNELTGQLEAWKGEQAKLEERQKTNAQDLGDLADVAAALELLKSLKL